MHAARAAGLIASVVFLIPSRPTAAMAQSAVADSLRIIVADSNGAHIPNVDVQLSRESGQPVAAGQTDSAGTWAFVVPVDTAEYQATLRRIGFRPTDRHFRIDRSNFTLAIVLAPAYRTLSTVRVTADQDLKRKSYFIDASTIERSARPLYDALDVIRKLRPDMLTGRGGPDVCPPLTNVWVNGVRIRDVAIDPTVVARMPRSQKGRPRVPGSALTILSQIRPEHILEMSYHDCFDGSLGVNGGENAVFIVLKPGVGYTPGVGTRMVDSEKGPHR